MLPIIPTKIKISRLSLSFSTLFFKRSMMSSATRSPLRLLHPSSNLSQTALQPKFRNPTIVSKQPMSSLHSGRLKSKSGVVTEQTDSSGRHQLFACTFCNDVNCNQRNCADPNSTNPCPKKTAQEHQQEIPPTGTTAEFETYIVGNPTSKAPKGKKTVNIDPDSNFKQQQKPQEMVVETNPPKVDAKDIVIDPKATAYVQDPKHHNAITNATTADHSSKNNIP